MVKKGKLKKNFFLVENIQTTMGYNGTHGLTLHHHDFPIKGWVGA
jgi:hypothetical protein